MKKLSIFSYVTELVVLSDYNIKGDNSFHYIIPENVNFKDIIQ